MPKKEFRKPITSNLCSMSDRHTTGVATILGTKIHGFAVWWLWRTYYLGNLPTAKKKLKVMGDWTSDLRSNDKEIGNKKRFRKYSEANE
jgi:NADH dehydrogenase FAD-containing subunit